MFFRNSNRLICVYCVVRLNENLRALSYFIFTILYFETNSQNVIQKVIIRTSNEEKKTIWALGERKPLQADYDRRKRLAGYVTFFDLNHELQQEDEFVQMVLSPKLLPLLSRVCGDGGLGDDPRPDGSKYHGIVRYAGDMVLRCVPPEGHDSAGYTSWHRDHPLEPQCT